MSTGKIIKRGIAFVAVAIILVCVILYIQANRAPKSYQPRQLTPEQREREALTFINQKIFQEFNNEGVQLGRPYEWSITEEQANRALASMDEIAFGLGGPVNSRGSIQREMDRAGVSGPAISLRDGKLGLMAYSRQFDKVLGAELSFSFNPEGKLLVRLEDVRIGRLPMPHSMIDQKIDSLRQMMSGAIPPSPQKSPGNISSEDIGRIMVAVFSAVNGQPIVPEFKCPGNRMVRVDDIRIANGTLTLHIRPVDPALRNGPKRPRPAGTSTAPGRGE